MPSRFRVVATLIACALSSCVGVGDRFPSEPKPTAGIFLDEALRAPSEFVEPARPVIADGINLTKLSEGYRGDLYNDAADYCTIGYGHLIKRKPCDGTEASEFLAGLSEPAAGQLLIGDMMFAQVAVSRLVKVPMSDGQYAALCDFVYNVGSRNFETSTVLVKVNGKQLDAVPVQLRRWTLANGKPFEGLRIRREREIALFFTGRPIPAAQFTDQAPPPPIDIRMGE